MTRKQPQSVRRSLSLVFLCAFCGLSGCVQLQAASAQPPALDQPVNDFAHVVDASSAAEMSRMIRALQAATGDVVVVATVPTIEPYATVEEYTVKLFENGGRGIGQKGKDNGLLIVLAMKERRVKVEVGYGLEEFVTDGFAGETSREYMRPRFQQGQFGPGLVSGTERIIGRIAQGRGVSLEGVRVPQGPMRGQRTPPSFSLILLLFIIVLIISRIGGGPGGRRRFWGGPFVGGWSSGVGPFGGGFGGGGGGFGGGFGGFGGGGSGGGGGGSSW